MLSNSRVSVETNSVRWEMTSKTSKSDLQAPRKVVIVAYEGVKLMDVAGPLQAFNDACFENGRPAYRVTLALSEAGGLVFTDTRVELETVRLDEATV